MRAHKWLIRPMVLAVGGCFGAVPAWANPTGPQVMHGNVQMQGLGTNHLKVTNSPNSIIHWQGFSVGAGQITQFQQQSAASAVLNRVVGPDISSIHGQLLSNGRVFLINPAGIIVGPGGVIDTAGFVGSTLNMLNADFLSGKLRFEGGAGAGSIVNQGLIRAGQNGNIILAAPNIENSGVLQTEGGQLVLAAGKKLTIGDVRLEGVEFEIQAPSDSVVNIGKLLAEDGAVGVFAGTLKHSGDIRANALTRDEAGRIVLKGNNEVSIAGGSSISADGRSGGDILIQSRTGTARVAGSVTATGSERAGGDIKVLGDRVSIAERGLVDASGMTAGGQIRVGGDYLGQNASLQNASRAFVGPDAMLRADATGTGDGGRIIVWADGATQFYGALSARGGVLGGNGGFAEVSGKETLIFAGTAKLDAPKGAAGTLLLDPLDLFIDATGGSNTSIIDEAGDVPNNAVTITPDALAGISGNVVLHAGRYMLFRSPVNLTRPGQSLTATVAEWTPTDPAGAFSNLLYIGADITTNGGAVSFTAPQIRTGGGAPTHTITTNGGAISLMATRGGISGPLDLNAGTGAVTAFAPKIPIPDTDPQLFDRFQVQLGNVTGGSLNISIAGSINVGNVMTTGPVSLTSAEQGIGTGNINSGPGNVSLNAMWDVGTGSIMTAGGGVFMTSIENSVFTGDIMAGGGNVALMSRSGVSANLIDTTGNVNLLATEGNVVAGVNNAASVTASATRTDGSDVQTVITQTGGTPLNLNSVSATATGCFNPFNNCAEATVNVNAMGDVRVGTVTATAPVTTLNNTNALVRIDSTQGSILPMSAASRITAVDVSLTTGSPGGLTPDMGGSVGTAALPLNVDVRRSFNMRAGGEFDVLFGGDGPNQLTIDVGVARAGQMFSGNLRHGSNVLLNATANDNTVTLNSLPTTGFDQRVFQQNPRISFNVPNGNLNVPAVTVPEGDTGDIEGSPGLDVLLSARNNITIGSYTRVSSPESAPKFTSVTSEVGSVDIGTFNANRDDVVITGPAGVTISPTSLTTQGTVEVNSTAGALNIGKITSGGGVALNSATGNITVTEINNTSGGDNVIINSTSGNITITQIDSAGAVSATTGTGNITVASIDTRMGTGGVTLRISCADNNSCGVNPAVVGAASDNPLFEVQSGGFVSVTGHTIGTQGPAGMRFQNPLDLQSAPMSFITLSSPSAGGRIGFTNDAAADNIPIVAETPDLRLIAGTTTGSGLTTAGVGGTFFVNTGAANLQRLSLTVNPAGLSGAGATSVVRTNANDYSFGSQGGNVVFGLPGPGGTVGPAEFTAANAIFSVDTHEGGIEVTTNANLNNALFSLNARAGSITAMNVTGRALTLSSGTANDPGRGTAVAVVTGTINLTEDVSITAGRNNNFFTGDTSRAGRVQTGPIAAARDVTINAFGEHPMPPAGGPPPAAIRIDNAGVPGDIGTAGMPVRNVTLNANFANVFNSFSASGRIEAADIFAQNITATSLNRAYTLGNLFATGTANSSIQLHSRQAITVGTLDAPIIHIRQQPNFNASTGAIATGDIGTTMAGRPRILNLRGTSVTVGAVTLDTTTADTVDIHGSGAGGRVTIGASGTTDALVGGDGSTINITNAITTSGAAPFTFSRIDAGNTGVVNINSPLGIRQTADGATDGITARTITLTTGTTDAMNTRPIDNPSDGVNGQLDLRNGSELINLTITSGGPVALNANNAALSALTILRNASSEGPQAFTLSNLGAGPAAQTVNIGNAGGALTVEVESTTALNLSITHNGINNRGITLAGDGITTSGGNVTLSTNNGPLNTTVGGITTFGPERTGNVTLSTSGGNAGSITTGMIDTRPLTAMLDGGNIDVTTNCANCNIAVNGNLDAGTSADTAGFIRLRALNSGSVTGAGTITSASPNTVTVFTNNGNIGAMGAALSIVSPTVNLEARGGVGNGIGTVFAALTGTDNLTLRADSGFNVSSTVALNRLILSTRGSGLGTPGAGTLNLTAPGQTYSFARMDTTPPDPPDQFQVITARGTTPADSLTTASFTALDGDLLVTTGAELGATNLTLASSARDVLITGAVTLQNTSQTFSASRHITVQAQGGSILIDGGSQSFSATSGNVSFLGGAGADESMTVSASSTQQITNSRFSAGGLNLTAGSGDRSFVTMLYTGAGTQTVGVGGNINITGGDVPGTGSFAEMRTTTGGQLIRSETDINVTAGLGTNADARIINASANHSQQIGESSFANTYQTNNITLRGGGAESSAEITSAGTQRIRINNGTLTLRGGTGVNAYAKIESTSATTQEIGVSNPRIGAIDMEGGSAAGTSVEILAAGSQTVLVNNSTRLAGGSAAGAHALMRSATSQNVTAGNFVLLGGSAPDAFARMTTLGTQVLNYSAATLTGGTAMGTFSLVDAGGNQTLNGGDITLNAAGLPPLGVPAGNAGAGFRGHSQTVNAGAVMINAGTGLDGSASDAVFENLSGDQNFNVGSIVINGGIQHSRGGIFNPAGAGIQFISAPNGISLTGAAAGPGADVLIDNAAMTMQTVEATGGSIILDNVGSGVVGITGAEKQAITASAIAVLTSGMSSATAHSTIFAPDTQYLRTTGAAGPPNVASVHVATLGSGRADIRTHSNQLIEADYFEVATGVDRAGSILIGDANGMGTSLIHGQNQSIFARTLTVQGPAAGTMSKLTGVNVQAISTLDGVIDVLGGSGANSVAAIDPTIQTIVANGGLGVLGGSAANATAAIVSTGPQQIYVTKGDATVQAGGANGTAAIVQAAGDQVFAAAGLLTVAGSAAGTGAPARIFTTAGSQTVNFGSLALAANAGSAADITSPGTQSLTGGAVTMTSNTPNGAALIQSAGDQTVNVGAITMAGGANPNAVSRIMSGGAQTITFNGLTMNAGAGAGSFVKIDSSGGQTLTGGGGAVALTASAGGTATIEGRSQTVTCAGCSLTLTGNSGAQILNLSGVQTVVAGLIRLFGGQASTTGIRNQGTGAQSVTATAGEILLESHPNAAASGRVVIENMPATGQTIAAAEDITLLSHGSGTVAATSGGSQSVQGRALDVRTSPSSAGSAMVQSMGDQTVQTTGFLTAEPGVGVRVVSGGTGQAAIQTQGNQVINVAGNQLLIGRLHLGPPGPVSASDFMSSGPAAGDSLVLATSEAANPNQTVTAGSVYIQGPSGDFRRSELSGDGTQTVTADRISVIGGSGHDAFAVIDPTNQTITSTSNMLLQGGSGPNADALINAIGPQTVTSQTGSIFLIGGSGPGADALIVTTSPFQTVSAPNGAVILTQGPVGGGIAGLQQGSNLQPAQLRSSLVIDDIVREQEELEELRKDVNNAGGQQTEQSAQETRVPLCT